MDEILELYNITYYHYDVADKTLVIYQSMLVEDFVEMKAELKSRFKVENIIIIDR